MVAKSFQNLEIVEGPFTSNGRQYVKVKSPRGNIRAIRWYTEAEYNRLFPSSPAEAAAIPKKSQKDSLGFSKGYITIFKGDTYPYREWFRASIARYARWWGWYIISTDEVPKDLPADLEPIKLPWEVVGSEDGKLFENEQNIKKAVEALIYEESNSEFIGKIGERLELYLTVERVIELSNGYGNSIMHLMRDDDGNLYVWTTASKSWEVGSEHHIRGTVKDHRTYRNEKQTVLSRCLEIKE